MKRKALNMKHVIKQNPMVINVVINIKFQF
jgi:hypothetical protein